MSRCLNLIDHRYGKLVVAVQLPTIIKTRPTWLCKCDCGKFKIALTINLRAGDTKSCGCLKRDILMARNLKHGHSTRGAISPTMQTWKGMKGRCLEPTHKDYKDYGGRGIKICHRWTSFKNFLEDMGEKPKHLSLDRIDNGGNYEEPNCRWATAIEQANNKRNNVFIEHKGKRQTIAQWAREKGFTHGQLHDRLIKLKWPVEKALETPVCKR